MDGAIITAGAIIVTGDGTVDGAIAIGDGIIDIGAGIADGTIGIGDGIIGAGTVTGEQEKPCEEAGERVPATLHGVVFGFLIQACGAGLSFFVSEKTVLFSVGRVGPNGAHWMRKLIGIALLAITLTLGISVQIPPAAAETKKAHAVAPSDLSARRHHRHERYAYPPNYPYPMYYGRPVYYAPKPFLPIPPLWGYGWEWW